ncbi:MAG: RagB/SusD family nutrient uptake outer membrane protein [Verrucomicrobia bacterium]|nr:RagB/SusD family nutrient uptake outer membrane protein [Prolixibacteraceae bacterium]
MSLVCIISVAGCKKEFINRNPLDTYASENFWRDENDVKIGIAGVYATLNRGEGFGPFLVWWDGLSDDGFVWSAPWQNTGQGQVEATSTGPIQDVYYNNYRSIGVCNYFLANIGKANLGDAKTNSYSAEVRFLRAYYYLQLTEIYGGVIITEKPAVLEDIQTNLPRSSKADVVKFMLQDLDFAIANLPNTAYTDRAVKGSAQALKARVLLYNERWAEAAAAANEVITSTKFSLFNDFRGMFIKPQQRSAANTEVMFSIRFQAPNLTHQYDYRIGWPSFATVQALGLLVESYEATDGLPITSSPLYNPARPYDKRDPRLRYNVYTPGHKPWLYAPDSAFTPMVEVRTGFMIRKGIDETRSPYGYNTISDQDIVLLRYADVLLMYAEAQNEATGPDASVYAAVNQVRARPGVNMPPLPAGLSKDQMRIRVRQERRSELAFEGLRFFDLKRWKIAKDVLSNITNPGGAKRKFDDKHYVWPIPQAEINILGSGSQNPGY